MYDLLIVGGGINGVGIARDAAGRGLRVVLVEKDDFARHTSSWSTKLIHGGLRYLEFYEFRLVREALRERDVLLKAAPHLIRPLRFVLPHHKGLRPKWMLRAGLFLYDLLAGWSRLPKSRRLDLRSSPVGVPLKPDYKTGFEYTDCQVDDARLVIANAIDARERGADLLPGTRFIGGRRTGAAWDCTIRRDSGADCTIRARALVNAAGPWVSGLFDGLPGTHERKSLRLVKGSHIVTRRLFDHDRAYIFQNDDRRICFAIPWVGDTTLIGTTDEPYSGTPESAKISPQETDYLLSAVNAYLKAPVSAGDILATFSGVRPLHDDVDSKSATAVTRDYAFDVDRGETGQEAALLSIYGGKMTTYRKLAEHALKALSDIFPDMGQDWTANACLPGGTRFDAARPGLLTRYGFVPEPHLHRLMHAHGDRLSSVLGTAQRLEDLGEHFGAGLYEIEARYLIEEEWARAPSDILERRTKSGLFMSEAQISRFKSWFDAQGHCAGESASSANICQQKTEIPR